MNIIKLAKFKEEKEKTERYKKYKEIREALINYFIAQDNASGVFEIPATVRANSLIADVIRTPNDIDYFYEKLINYKKEMK